MTVDVVMFDLWRQAYPMLSFAEQQQFMRVMGEVWPVQRHATVEHVQAYLDRFTPHTVIELGGWDGWLAQQCLARHPDIRWWVNVELWPDAPERSVCDDPRYSVDVLDDWVWNRALKADAFVSCHTLEHMTAVDVTKVVRVLDTATACVEIPIERGEREDVDWTGYDGTHILEWEWGPVERCFAHHGYEVAHRVGDTRWFT